MHVLPTELEDSGCAEILSEACEHQWLLYINIAPPKTNMTKWKLAIFLIGDVELHFFVFLCIVMLRSFQGVVLLTSVNAKGDAWLTESLDTV